MKEKEPSPMLFIKSSFVTEHVVNKFKEASTKIEIRNVISYLKPVYITP